MHMQKSFIGLVVMASSFLAHAEDVTKQGSVAFSIAAERLDVPTLTVGIGSPVLGLYFDFAEHKFKTSQPMGLNIAAHNPSATFSALQLRLASVTANDHKLKSGANVSPYNFYMGTSGGSIGTYKVPHSTSHQDPFSGLSELTSAELAMANLRVFDGLFGSRDVNVSATTYVSLESESADSSLTDGSYTDTASLYVQTTWKEYAANP